MPSFATTDAVLAIAHHILIFALAGVIAFEVGVARATLGAKDIARLAKVDMWYGILAGLILIVGFSRAIWAAKGWAYYDHNLFFWLKIGSFAVVGLLSIWPTVAYIRWRRMLAADPQFLPAPAAIATVRRFLWGEVFFFAMMPVFAALMARGYGEFSP